MSRKGSHRNKARVKTGSLVAAALVTAAALGVFVWLAVEKFGVSGSSDSVELKKSPTSFSQSSSEIHNSSSQAQTSTQQTTTAETTTQPAKTAPAQVVIAGEAAVAESAVTIKWEKTEGADGYDLYRLVTPLDLAQQDSSAVGADGWQLLKSITDAQATSFTDQNVEEGKKYDYKVAAFAMDGTTKLIGSESRVVSAKIEPAKALNLVDLYDLPSGTQIFKDNGGKLQLVNTLVEQGFYTGLADEKFKGYVAIDYMFETRYVKQASVKKVDGAVALPTSVIGQEGGQIFGSSACGPTASAVIVRYDKGDVWDKDDLIRFTEKNKLADQGSMMGEVGKGGMSAPMVIKLIEMYSGGKYTATNVFDEKVKTSELLCKVIDSGKHSILSVRYAWGIVHHPYSIIHFVEPSAYSVEGGKLFFYYGDTAYGNGPKGLKKVAADELDESVATVEGEPKCIIVLN